MDMDLLSDNSTLTVWLLQYGSIALFFLLGLGIVALPVPDETLLVLTGGLIYHEKLSAFTAIPAAYIGVICGITGSFLLGRMANHVLIPKYGKWIGITPERVNVAHTWFERYGKWTLFVGYFIPGVRHFTGFVAGTADLAYHQFALFAYTGAVVWVTLFLSIGYFFGTHWHAVFSYYKEIELKFDWVAIGIGIGLLVLLLYAIFRARRAKE
jgi:membrane protein DedA with SNARE-associated domain